MNRDYRAGRHVYFAQDTDERRLIKIGASNDPPRRVRMLSREIGRPVRLLGVIHHGAIPQERIVHDQLAGARVDPPDLPTTEWFEPTDDVIAFIGRAAEDYQPEPKEKSGTAKEYQKLRRSIGSQQDVAEMLGVHPMTISRRERGELDIDAEAEHAIRRLAEQPTEAA